MKTLTGIVLTIIMMFLFTSGHCATYYMRADGTAANKAAATSCGTAGTAMSISTMNGLGNDFSAGDILYYCDDAGKYNSTGDIIRCFSAGSSGNEITHMNAPGDTPIICGADTVAVGSWTADGSNWYWQPPTNGAGSTRIEPAQVWEDDSRLTWKEWTVGNPIDGNGQWAWDDTNERVYIRSTDGTLNVEVMEVGQRCSGIYISDTAGGGLQAKADNEYIIIDGIQVEKVAGKGDDKSNPHIDGDGDNLIYSMISGGGDHIIVRNCVVKQMGGGKYYVAGGGVSDTNWSQGIEFYDGDDCHAYNNIVYDGHCGGIDAETLTAGATIGYFVYDNTIYDIDGTGLEIWASGGEFYNNYIYNCGKVHTSGSYQFGIRVAGTSVLPIKVYQNKVYDTKSSLRIYGTTGAYNESIFYNIFNTFSGTGLNISNNSDDVDVFNNVFYDSDGSDNVIKIQDAGGSNDDIVIKNCIIYGKNNYLFRQTGTNDITLDNNCYYRIDAGNTWHWAGTDYTYAQSATYFAAHETNSIASDPKFRDETNGDFALLWGSPCINAGANLGASYDDAFDPRDPTFPYDMLDQDLYGAWEIGAFVYVRRYEISKRASEMYLNMGLIQ